MKGKKKKEIKIKKIKMNLKLVNYLIYEYQQRVDVGTTPPPPRSSPLFSSLHNFNYLTAAVAYHCHQGVKVQFVQFFGSHIIGTSNLA